MRGALSPKVNTEMYAALERLEKLQGQKLGTGDNPLLVFRALRRKVFHARHDGHHSQPWPQRSGR